jgi:hypothetical protein
LLLSTAGYLLPTYKLEIKPRLYLPSDPHAWPFDLSFNPDPGSPPKINHTCPYTTVGFDITISFPPPCLIFDPTSSNVTKILTPNAGSHLQKYEKKKLGRDNKTNPTMGSTTIGNTVICDILDQNKILLPLAIDPHGQLGPTLQHFFFDIQATNPIRSTQAKLHATLMYSKIMHFPSPKGVLTLDNHNWKNTQSRQFYGHSYFAPTLTINTLQQLGLTLIKAFPLHIRYATKQIYNHSLPTPPLIDPNPPCFGQQVGF